MEKDSSEIAKLKERIAKDPRSKLFVPLAEEYKKIGDIATAVRVLTEGLKNNPGYVTARSFLGRLLLESGDLAGAQKELEEVIKAIPDNLLAQRKLGDLHALRGEREDALKRYRAALALNPGDKEITSLVADLESGKDISSRIPGPKQAAVPTQAAKPAPPALPGKTISAAATAATKLQTQPVPSGPKVPAVPATPQKTSSQPRPAPPQPSEPVVERKAASAETTGVLPAPVSRGEGVSRPSSTVEKVTERGARPGATGAVPEAAPSPPSPAEEVPSLDAAMTLEEAASAVPFKPVEKGREPEVFEEILELEPLEPLAAEAAALQEEPSVSIASEPAQPSAAPLPGEFDLSEPVSGPVPFAEEQPREWTPPAEMQTGGPEEQASQAAQEASDDINTDTLAELYISQAFYEKAIEIYERMLSERPGTVALEQKLQKLRALAASAGPTGAPVAASPKEISPSGTSQVEEGAQVGAGQGQQKVVEPIEPPWASIPPKAPAVVEGKSAGTVHRSLPAVQGKEPAAAETSRRIVGSDETLKAMQEALEGAERQEVAQPAVAGAGIPVSQATGAARRKETIDRLENWLKNIMKEKPG